MLWPRWIFISTTASIWKKISFSASTALILINTANLGEKLEKLKMLLTFQSYLKHLGNPKWNTASTSERPDKGVQGSNSDFQKVADGC